MDEHRQGLLGRIQRILRRFIDRNTWPSGSAEPDDDDDDAFVGAQIRPRPHLNSGAVALEEPDDFDR